MPTEAANLQAEGLLRSTLSTGLLEEYDEKGYLTVNGSSGGRYRIRMGRAGNVRRIGENDEPEEVLCLHPVMDVPDADTVLTQILLLWTDEPRFLDIANRYRLGGGTPRGPDPRQRICGSIREFSEAIATRMRDGHQLSPQDDPYRLYRGFEDATADEWVVVSIRLVRTISDEDAEPLGMSGAKLREQFAHATGMYLLLGMDVGEMRSSMISRSLETARGRDALAEAILARIRYGGPLPEDIRFELIMTGNRVLEASQGDGGSGVQGLREWLDAQD